MVLPERSVSTIISSFSSGVIERILSLRNARILLVAVFIAWLCWQIASAYPGVPTPDTCRQLEEGLSGKYTNWKPTLYSWFLGAADSLLPGHGIAASFLLQLAGLGWGVFTITWSLIRRHVGYSLLIFILPLFFTQKGMCIYYVGNDALAAACYLCFIGSSMMTSDTEGHRSRVIGFIFCAIFAFAGISLRHNALPLMFLLIFWACRRLNRTVIISALASAVSLAVLTGASLLLTYGILRAEASYPLKSPFADDIVNLDILEGRWSEICLLNGSEHLPAPHDMCKLSADVPNFGCPLNPYGRIDDPVEREKDYRAFRHAWLTSVCSHPERYVLLKIFFFHQNLLIGRSLPIFNDMILARYPHVTIRNDGPSRQWYPYVCREFFVLSGLPLISYATLLLLLAVPRRHHRISDYPQPRRDALSIIGASLLYTSTFTLLTLSSTELRYYVIRASLCAVGIGILFLSAVLHRNDQQIEAQ